MATIVTRQEGATAKGSPLTNTELDNNFINLNTELGQKLPLAGGELSGILKVKGTTFTLDYSNNGTPVNGYLITTSIPFISFQMPWIRVQGYAYGNGQVIDFTVVYYTYPQDLGTGAFTSAQVYNYGTWDPGTVSLAINASNNVVLHIPTTIYYGRFTVTLGSSGDTIPYSYLTGWTVTDAVCPTAKKVSPSKVQILNSSNYNSYAPTLTGTGASGTWPISISGNAASVSSISSAQVTTALGYTPVNRAGDTMTGTLIVPYLRVQAQGVEGGEIYLNKGSGQTNLSGSELVFDAFGDGLRFFESGGSFRQFNFSLVSGGISSSAGGTFLHSGNYNSYSPTLTGGNASGDWNIRSASLYSNDNRVIAPNEDSANNLRFGFTSWSNNNTSPYADYLHLRSYVDGSGGNDNLVLFRKDQIGMRIYQQTFGSASAYSTYKDIAFTDGTNASGNWPINVTGSAGSVAWTNVTDRPTAVSSFSNDSGYITSAYTGFMLRSPNPQTGINSNFNSSAYRFDPSVNNPTNEHYSVLTYGNESNVVGQLATHYTSGQTYARAYNTSWSAWRTLLDSSNYSSYALPLSGGTVEGTVNTRTSVIKQNQYVRHIEGKNWDTYDTAGSALYLNYGNNQPVYIGSAANLALHAGNYNSYALPLSGGNITGNVTFATDFLAIRPDNGTPASGNYFRGSSSHLVIGTGGTLYLNYGNTGGNTFIYGATTLEGNLRSNGTIRSGADFARPVAQWGASGTTTGAVVISFPGSSGNYGMVHAVIDVYEYSGNTVSTIIVGGHNWYGGWYNYGANVIGKSKEVRLGYKNGKYCIIIGTASSSWSYGSVVLRKIHTGTYYSGIMDMAGTFTITQDTDADAAYSNLSGDLRSLTTNGSLSSASSIIAGTSVTAGTAFVGTYSPWTGDENKIQWHSNNLYFVNTGGGSFLFRNSAGSHVFTISNTGEIAASSSISGGYIYGTYFNSSAGNSENPTIGQIWTQSTGDNYLRKSTPAHFISQLSLLTTSNYSSYALPLTGGTVTGVSYFRSNPGSGVYLGNTNSPPLQVYSNDGGAAFMSFHRSGYYAVNIGLDPDNVLRIGGWSASSNRLQLNMNGNLTIAGALFPSNESSTYYTGSSSWNSFYTPNGYIFLGPANADWGHIYTDRPNFYFNKNLYVNGSLVLHAGNYNSYSLPLSGGTLTGTLKVNTSGSGSSSSHVIIKRSGATEPATFGSYSGSWRSSIEIWNNDSTRMLFLNPPESDSLYANIKSVGGGFFIDVGSNGGTRAIQIESSGSANFPVGLSQSGNQVLHAGNYTSYSPSLTGSGASGTWGISITGNAATVSSLSVHTGTNNEANKIVRTDGNGYIQAGWINTTSGDAGRSLPARFYATYGGGDQYIRYYDLPTTKAHLGNTAKYNESRPNITSDTNYWTGIMGWGATDWNTLIGYGSGFVDSWGSPANMPGDGGTHHVGIQALHYTTGSSSYGWQMVNGSSLDRWWLRYTWGSGFSGWRELVHSNNYTNYSPSLTGTGASGTWGISISGSAAQLNGYSSAENGASVVLRTASNGYLYLNNWINVATAGLFSTTTNGSHFYPANGSYGSWAIDGSRNGWSGLSFGSTSNGRVNLMVGLGSNFTGFYNESYGWQAYWNSGTLYCAKNTYGGGTESVVLDATNYSNYTLPLGGGTVTGATYFRTNVGGSTYLGSVSNASLQAYSTDAGPAYMSFHRAGYYAVNMGLDPDNVFRIGGWSASSNRLQMDMSGNLTMAGNVTASSDERIKTDWKVLNSDFIYNLARVKSGTFKRIDLNIRQAGSSAQDWQKLLPEVVHHHESDDLLSLNYGAAALVSAVELAKKVVSLEEELKQLKSLVNKILNKD